jgi:CRISPR system Cascade subunit CasC
MLIDIHMLQNYAPSNLNRDDTGAPKDAIFGNATRARISSQAIKRSIRRSEIFEEAFRGDGLLAQRTRRLPGLLRPELAKLGLDEAAVDLIVTRSQEIGRESGRNIAISEDEGDPETAQLIFLSDAEVTTLAGKLADLYRTHERKGFEKLKIEELTRALGASVPRSVDIAMFGRMTTSAAFENVDAAVQVAHAISTHAMEPEFDYYTAVDDISGESGAGFIGDTAFNSATYYKYFSIHWEGLIKNLGGDAGVAARAVAALIEAAAVISPTGKQNSFAAHNLPDLVLVEVRGRNLPVSYANAFVDPVWTKGRPSLIEKSTKALADYMGTVNGLYNIDATRAWVSTNDVALPDAARQASLRDLLAWLPLNGAQAS